MNASESSLNDQTFSLLKSCEDRLSSLRIDKHELGCGATVYDFGIATTSSLSAGLLLARVCMADRAEINYLPANAALGVMPMLQVTTDDPVQACMASQYAGWPVQVGKYFAMGSGPMRTKRGKEKVLLDIAAVDSGEKAVGVLETDKMPTDEVAIEIAQQCNVDPTSLALCVAPTRSIAGVVQVVARSVETALHKIHELGGDLQSIVSAIGIAPVPPPAIDFAAGIGRTNDAILYGGSVTLWIKNDAELLGLIDQVPSCSSKDWGTPFVDIFAACNHDFYKIDPHLFAPAVLTMIDLSTGTSATAGQYREDCLAASFGIKQST